MSSITAVSVLGLNDHPRYFFFRENDIVRALALQGWPDEAQSDPWQVEAAARDTLARWVASGLPVHYINGQHAFDIGHVLNFMRLRGLEAYTRRNGSGLSTVESLISRNIRRPRW